MFKIWFSVKWPEPTNQPYPTWNWENFRKSQEEFSEKLINNFIGSDFLLNYWRSMCRKSLATLMFIDFSKAFHGIHKTTMVQILLTYGLPKETVTAIIASMDFPDSLSLSIHLYDPSLLAGLSKYILYLHRVVVISYWSLLTLFCFLNSGFLTTILPYRPASVSLLLTVDVDIFFTTLVLLCSAVWSSQLSVMQADDSDEIYLCIGKIGSI